MTELKIVDHLYGVGTLTIDCPANWTVWFKEENGLTISRMADREGDYAPRMAFEVSLKEGKVSASELETQVKADAQRFHSNDAPELVGPTTVEDDGRIYSVVQVIWGAEDAADGYFEQYQGVTFPKGSDTVLVLARFITPSSDPENPAAQELREILGTLARVVTSADDQHSPFL